MIVGADFNGHIGEGNRGDEEVIGKHGFETRNTRRTEDCGLLPTAPTWQYLTPYTKREEHTITYSSGGRRTQVDYILCRRRNLGEIRDCKVIPGESVAKQHQLVVGILRSKARKRKAMKAELRIKCVEAERGRIIARNTRSQ